MTTQGLVTLTKDGNVTHKIIVGCDGYNADKLVGAIKNDSEPVTIGRLVLLAMESGFGCGDCRVVLDENSSAGADEELDERYRRTFKQPEFNPRWENGTADYVRVVEC